ncbi:MAG: H-type small acid-soluble spore protein [Bacillota bacterium]|nr:H-type small acid-soluble spore protein [Bacillota bacterium]
MKFTRAEEILKNTSENIDVTYKDSSVWLERVNSADQTVLVKELTGNKLMEVAAEDLIEKGNLNWKH